MILTFRVSTKRIVSWLGEVSWAFGSIFRTDRRQGRSPSSRYVRRAAKPARTIPPLHGNYSGNALMSAMIGAASAGNELTGGGAGPPHQDRLPPSKSRTGRRADADAGNPAARRAAFSAKEANMAIQLNFINSSAESDNADVVIFQKNVKTGYSELQVAWRSHQELRAWRQSPVHLSGHHADFGGRQLRQLHAPNSTRCRATPSRSTWTPPATR